VGKGRTLLGVKDEVGEGEITLLIFEAGGEIAARNSRED